jgi:prepilin-type N-terminal cleavage/methylation domain-containing protein
MNQSHTAAMTSLAFRRQARGFTLAELMVAMAITTIIVAVLVSITSVAVDTWNRSRAELRAARQARLMVDLMARDFESLVVRRGNAFEWLSATSPQTLPGERVTSSNAAELIFFSASTQRYNGEIGGDDDNGGDVSCIAYRLDYKDPIDQGGTAYKSFVLNRLLVNPDETFENLLAQEDLETAFASYSQDLEKPENFVCENIYQFTVTFHAEVAETTSGKTVTTPVAIPLGAGNNATAASFSLTGNGIDTPFVGDSGVSADQIRNARLKAVEVSATVLSDTAMDQIRKGAFNANEVEDFIARNSFHYSKRVGVTVP